jgi:cytochrome c553
MWIRLCWIGLTVLSSASPQNPMLKIGGPAPEIMVRDHRGAEVPLTAYRQKKIVVLFVQNQGGLLPAEVRENASRRLEPLNAVALFLSGGAQGSTILIDSAGTVRRMLEGQVLTGAQLAEFVSVWQLGRSVFATSCARCHGVDGDIESCMDVKRLAGIGRRLTAAQIRERLRIAVLNPDQLMIRGQFFKRAEVDAVIVYVSGL